MSRGGRLHLDNVISSVPELGPTLPDGTGYSWIVLVGMLAIQMTVPCITAMYGVVLGHLSINSSTALDLWKEDIVLTPILFTAFLNLADPWTRIMVSLATIPRLVGLIGVCLLSIGALASGYLATGGMAAYLASVSAGAIMGIGGNFILVQTENVIRKNFRIHLQLALTLKQVSTSLGFIFAPGFVLSLLSRFDIQIGLLLMSLIFLPTALGTLVLRYPVMRSRSSLYTLLISEEENEVNSRVDPDITEDVKMRDNSVSGLSSSSTTTATTVEDLTGQNSVGLFREGSDSYSYQDADDVQEHFNILHGSSFLYQWDENLYLIKSRKFWIGMTAGLGSQLGGLFIWILLPSLAVLELPGGNLAEGVALTMAAGLGTLVTSAASYWKPRTARWTSFFFGGSSWIGSFVLFGLSLVHSFYAFIFLAFTGGMSIAGTTIYLETALLDTLGTKPARVARTILSTIVGLCILTFLFIPNPFHCLRLAAVVQFLGGSYWIFIPLLGIIQAR